MAASLAYQAEVFGNRLKKRDRQLRKWAQRRAIGCYRVYDRDIPDLPLVVDRYERFVHINDYREPRDTSEEALAAFGSMVTQTVSRALNAPPQRIFTKQRRRTSGSDQYQRHGSKSVEEIVSEGGLRFVVNLSDYVDTGLFLDHRPTRQMVREWAADRRVLNLFSYTGSFTVYAAAGGARRTVSVDLSRTYTQWCQRNLEINGLAGSEHLQVNEDVNAYLQNAVREVFDLIIVDPPTFSNSKKTDTVLDIQRDHADLLHRCLRHLDPRGTLLFSTNAKRFTLDEQNLRAASIIDITRQTIDQDFLGTRPHRAWLITRAGSNASR